MNEEATVATAEAVTTPVAPRSVHRPLLALALALLAVAVVLEVVAGPVLRAAPSSHHATDVMAIPGVAAMVHGAQMDPTEIAQVAAGQHQPVPLALPAQALVDGLLLVSALVLALPRLLPGRDVTRRARLGLFLGSLAVLLGGVVVGVAAVARMRYLVALYRSPPFGTLSYLLLYGSSRRAGTLVALSVLMAVKVGAYVALFCAYPRAASERGMAGLALSSLATTVLAAFCYGWAPPALVSVTDALAGAVVALLAVLWAGVIVSGSVRRLA